MHRRKLLCSLALLFGEATPGFTAPDVVQKIRVSDGALIAVEPAGTGPTLLLVNGAASTRKTWARLVPLLSPNFRVYAMDRRGRGDSTEGANYSLDREAEDIAAVANILPGPVYMLAHSSGAICGMEAARRSQKIQRAVFYEPPLQVPGGIAGPPPASVCDAVAAGDNELTMLTFFRDYVRIPEPVSDAMRRDSYWAERVALAPATCREVRALFQYKLDAASFSKVSIPTLFLLGELSPELMQNSVRAAANAFRGSRIQVILGQSHTAMSTSPQLLARIVQKFLEA